MEFKSCKELFLFASLIKKNTTTKSNIFVFINMSNHPKKSYLEALLSGSKSNKLKVSEKAISDSSIYPDVKKSSKQSPKKKKPFQGKKVNAPNTKCYNFTTRLNANKPVTSSSSTLQAEESATIPAPKLVRIVENEPSTYFQNKNKFATENFKKTSKVSKSKSRKTSHYTNILPSVNTHIYIEPSEKISEKNIIFHHKKSSSVCFSRKNLNFSPNFSNKKNPKLHISTTRLTQTTVDDSLNAPSKDLHLYQRRSSRLPRIIKKSSFEKIGQGVTSLLGPPKSTLHKNKYNLRSRSIPNKPVASASSTLKAADSATIPDPKLVRIVENEPSTYFRKRDLATRKILTLGKYGTMHTYKAKTNSSLRVKAHNNVISKYMSRRDNSDKNRLVIFDHFLLISIITHSNINIIILKPDMINTD